MIALVTYDVQFDRATIILHRYVNILMHVEHDDIFVALSPL